jgi:hypothetical protein
MHPAQSIRHKLLIVGLLLALFAIPFLWQPRIVRSADSQALVAGGAVIGHGSATAQSDTAPVTNHAGQAADATGSSFLGVSAR